MNIAQECAFDAQRSRGDGAERGRGGLSQGRRRPPVQHHAEDRRQMGRTVPRGRCRMVCATAPPGLFHCQAKPRPPHAPPSRPCAGSATPASRSRPRSASRRRPSAASCGGLGLNRIRDLEPAEPVRRYEREHPGEMIHIDIKKLGRFERVGHRITGDRTGQSNRVRGAGWEFVHVCIDDASRIAFSQIMPDETQESAVPSSRHPSPTTQALASPSTA